MANDIMALLHCMERDNLGNCSSHCQFALVEILKQIFLFIHVLLRNHDDDTAHLRQSSGPSSLLSRQSLSPSHFQRSWMQRLFLQAYSPGWHWGGGT